MQLPGLCSGGTDRSIFVGSGEREKGVFRRMRSKARHRRRGAGLWLCCLCILTALLPPGTGFAAAAELEYRLRMELRREAALPAERPLFTSVAGLESGTYTLTYVYYGEETGGIQNRLYAGGTGDTYGILPAGRDRFTHAFTVCAEAPSFSLTLMSAESKDGGAYRGGAARRQEDTILTADTQATFEEQSRKPDTAPRAIGFGTGF